MLQGQWQLGLFGIDMVITVHALFVTLIAIYAVILIPYYAAYPWMRSKAYTFAQGVWFALRRDRSNPRLSPLARQAGLALLLKFFFAPLMINWCLIHVANLTGSLLQLIAGTGRRPVLARAVRHLAVLGRLSAHPVRRHAAVHDRLHHRAARARQSHPLRGSDVLRLVHLPRLLSAVQRSHAALPGMAEQRLSAVHQRLPAPHHQRRRAHCARRIFSWASIALGFKASNLTNRGIVTHGPYAFVRHPGYAAKNFAWWLGALPVLGATLAAGSLASVRLLTARIVRLDRDLCACAPSPKSGTCDCSTTATQSTH